MYKRKETAKLVILWPARDCKHINNHGLCKRNVWKLILVNCFESFNSSIRY